MKLEVEKSEVYEVARMEVEYLGAKMDGAVSYDDIMLTEANNEILDEFWKEASSGATEKLKQFVVSVMPSTDKYEVDVQTGRRYNEALTDSVQTSIKLYFVCMVVCKWLTHCKHESSTVYANSAVAAMDDVMRKLYNRKAPKSRIRNRCEIE